MHRRARAHAVPGPETDALGRGARGTTGLVHDVALDIEEWPPTCENFLQRGPILRCKHICFVLLLCGCPVDSVADPDWVPECLQGLYSAQRSWRDPELA